MGSTPLLEPESIHTTRCVKFLLKYGWKSQILTVDEKTAVGTIDKTMLEMVPTDIFVERTKSFEPKNLIKIISKTFHSLLNLRDNKVGWYFSASKKAISMCERTKYDLVHSWACYFTSNLVGLKVKQYTNLPWVAHFSDPWVDSPYHRYGTINRYLNQKMEKAVIENADAIVFVTEKTKRLVMRKYPSKMFDKAFVIPHCYERELFNSLKRKK